MKEFEYEYNPIKEQVAGKQAERVVWTTKAFELAVDGIKKGLPLKANPFCGKNTKLLKPDLVYKRTAEEIDDYVKCMQDPVYFASKCFLMTQNGLQACVLRDYQIRYLRHLQKNRFSIFLSCRQSGKSTTTAIYCLWVILFNTDKTGLILSKSGPAGQDLLAKIKDMYLYLPYHLKIGTMKWNQTSISFDNNSSISTEPFSPTAGLGKTINFLILDEFAWCPENDVELFYNNIIPTVTTISNSNVCIMSTQNGHNKFYELWKDAIEGRSAYGPFKVDWDEVPQFNEETKKWEKRDEAWHKYMVAVLGSEEAFQYQYGTQFMASDHSLVSRECMTRLHKTATKFVSYDDGTIPIFLMHMDNLYFDPTIDKEMLLTILRSGWFVILIDLAEGGGNDYTVFTILQIVGKDKFRQIGVWRSNTVPIKEAALEFWLLASQLFNNDRCIFSIEWNTYGALFYNYLQLYNEFEEETQYSWRFNIAQELDMTQIVEYPKVEADVKETKTRSTKKTIPGIKFMSSNKGASCVLLKMDIECGDVTLFDIVSINELECFEDANGTGTYKAAHGHDDNIMTFVQIPQLKKTMKYKDYMDDYEMSANDSMMSGDNIYNPFSPFTGNDTFANGKGYLPVMNS